MLEELLELVPLAENVLPIQCSKRTRIHIIEIKVTYLRMQLPKHPY